MTPTRTPSSFVLRLKDPVKLRRAIGATGLTQHAIADKAGISHSRIAQLVQGTNSYVGIEKAAAIAKACSVSVASLFELPEKRRLQRLGLIPTATK